MIKEKTYKVIGQVVIAFTILVALFYSTIWIAYKLHDKYITDIVVKELKREINIYKPSLKCVHYETTGERHIDKRVVNCLTWIETN